MYIFRAANPDIEFSHFYINTWVFNPQSVKMWKVMCYIGTEKHRELFSHTVRCSSGGILALKPAQQ